VQSLNANFVLIWYYIFSTFSIVPFIITLQNTNSVSVFLSKWEASHQNQRPADVSFVARVHFLQQCRPVCWKAVTWHQNTGAIHVPIAVSNCVWLMKKWSDQEQVWVLFMNTPELRIRQFPCSTTGPENGLSESGGSWFPSVPPGKWRGSTIN
jgi:hypothetical protein